MSKNSSDPDQKSLILFAKASRVLRALVDFLGVAVILALLLDIIANIITPLVPSSLVTFLKQIVDLVIRYPAYTALFVVIVLLLRSLASLGSRIKIPRSDKE